LEGRHATADELALAHDPAYIHSIERIASELAQPLDPGSESWDTQFPNHNIKNLDSDTRMSAGSWRAAIAAAGCVLDAVDQSVSGQHLRSFCAVRPPGHHALRDRAMGFCLFGNVAIGALYARKQLGLQRILIADWDVHHGNGTQALVQHDPDIHFVSMHQWPWYPGTGAADDRGPHNNVWNVPMPGGLSAERYTSTFEQSFDIALDQFTPDLIFISAGFDSLAGDPLGNFTLELPDVDRLTRFVTSRADELCGGRVVSVLEGGYNPDRVGEASVTHMRALAHLAPVQ
jgi:acetoin utilization deacetylase AcuC-like enzyme